jgi:FixJ family two-component response regulator
MSLKPVFICILDDDASVRNSIVQLLDSDGLKAQSFENAEVFLRMHEAIPCTWP